jgi:predicted choloylglycine hydrolase
LLDNCKSADDAKYLLKNVPIKSNVNILVADKNGCSFVAETVSTLENKKVSFRENDEFLISTNHYMNADMFEYDNHRKRHSVVRYKTIQKALTESKGAVTSETIKTILEQKIQNGVFCPYYKDYLGTLHTTIFNVSNTNVQVCLGTPESSKWQEISFNAPVEIASISETVHNEYADDPKTFWSVLPPGCMEVK